MRVLLKDVERGTYRGSIRSNDRERTQQPLAFRLRCSRSNCFFGLLVGVWVNRLSIRPIREAADVARDIASGRRTRGIAECC